MLPYKPGLTIRQHFAAMAMHGLVTQQAPVDRIINESNNHLLHQLSKASIIIADALIAELNKTNTLKSPHHDKNQSSGCTMSKMRTQYKSGCDGNHIRPTNDNGVCEVDGKWL